MALTISLHLPSLKEDFETGLRRAGELGLRHIDIAALVDRPLSHLEALADSGLIVVAADLVVAGEQSLASVRRQIADAARLGATLCCLDAPVPGEAFDLLDRFAAERMIRLCIPGPTGVLVDRESRIAHVRLDVTGPLLDEALLAIQVEQLCRSDYRGAVAIRLKRGETPHGG